jgi:GGDEF domain-containing protein
MDDKALDEKLSTLLVGLPKELSAFVRDKVAFYKTKEPVFTPEEIYREARTLVRLQMLAYLDRREYLGMYNRRWAEHKISEYIRQIVARPSMGDRDLYCLARVNFDLNGLKALNDLGGHEAGNKGLKLFANILNFGATTIWLRDELHLEVTSSAEGGDEFGLVIFGHLNLRELAPTIVHRYFEEVYAADVSHMLDFADLGVREKLRALGIAEEVPKGFVFKISTSVGISLFGEAFDAVDMSQAESRFLDIEKNIINVMFKLADSRATSHKSDFKRELGEKNPVLSGLYSRMSREVIHLERELRFARQRILELEQKLKQK